MNKLSNLTNRVAVANYGGAMEADTIYGEHEQAIKNGRNPKSQMSRCIINCFAIVAILVVCVSCGDGGDDGKNDDAFEAGKKFAKKYCDCLKIVDETASKKCLLSLDTEGYDDGSDSPANLSWERGFNQEGAKCNADIPEWFPDWEWDTAETVKKNKLILLDTKCFTNEFSQTESDIKNALADPKNDTIFLYITDRFYECGENTMSLITDRAEKIKNINKDKVWGRGELTPVSISKTDSTRLALMEFIVNAKKVTSN